MLMRQLLIHPDKKREDKREMPSYNQELKRRVEELQKYKGEA